MAVPQMALAASILAAVAVGALCAGRATGPQADGPRPAALAAAAALQGLPTGDTAALGEGVARVLGSFETEAGLCRLIAIEATSEERAVVCREGAGWSLAFAATTIPGGGFRTASSLAVETIDRVLDEMGAGAPLTVAEEAQALGL